MSQDRPLKILELTGDVAGERYALLIQEMLKSQHTFSLTWRDQLEHDESAVAVRSDLQALEVTHERTDRWPGTRLIGHLASVRHYRCDDRATSVLLRPGSLYSWLSPKFPEDLAFYDHSGDPVFATVAHEREGWAFGSRLSSWLGQIVTLAGIKLPSADAHDVLLGQ